MGLYYVETVFGCGIREAASLASAEASLRREVGTHGFKGLREATPKDLAWVEAMGGDVPRTARREAR